MIKRRVPIVPFFGAMLPVRVPENMPRIVKWWPPTAGQRGREDLRTEEGFACMSKLTVDSTLRQIHMRKLKVRSSLNPPFISCGISRHHLFFSSLFGLSVAICSILGTVCLMMHDAKKRVVGCRPGRGYVLSSIH